MKRAFWTTLLLLSALPFAFSQETGTEWLTDFDAAKKAAAEKKLPILVYFSGSDWCKWCVRFDNEILGKEEFKKFAADNLVLFNADFPLMKQQDERTKKQNAELIERYGAGGFPVVFLTDAEGKVFARTGYTPGGAATYVQHLKKLLAGREK